MERLAAIPLFGSFTRRGLSLILDLSVERVYEAETEIITEGDRGDDLFVIEEGTAEVFKGGRFVKALGRGDYFGEIALITSSRRNATVRAKTGLVVRVIRRRPFWRLREKIPDLEKRLLTAMAERMQEIGSSIS